MTTVTFWTKYLQAGLPLEYNSEGGWHCQATCESCVNRYNTCDPFMKISSDDLRTLISRFPEAFL